MDTFHPNSCFCCFSIPIFKIFVTSDHSSFFSLYMLAAKYTLPPPSPQIYWSNYIPYHTDTSFWTHTVHTSSMYVHVVDIQLYMYTHEHFSLESSCAGLVSSCEAATAAAAAAAAAAAVGCTCMYSRGQ